MATEVPGSNRPRPWLLIALTVVVGIYLATRMFSGGSTNRGVPTTAEQRPAVAAANGTEVRPQDLDVKVETLGKQQPALEDSRRNPFRFEPKPPEPPPSMLAPGPATPAPMVPTTPLVPPGPPEPPPIGETIKFIGIVEAASGKIGAFSVWDAQTRECKATFPGREGEVIEGRYRIVRLGIESAVLEYLDGRGRATLPLNGQACVKK